MNVYQWLCLFGVPTLFVTIVIAVGKYILNQIKAIRLGMQALLRAQMIDEYNKWDDRGYAPIYARQNFENCWAQYHRLGANGVMDDIHKKFLELPTEPPTRRGE